MRRWAAALIGGALLTTGLGAVAPGAAAEQPHDVALGAKYTVSTRIPNAQLQAEADAHYPDVGGRSLTDGVRAGAGFTDPGWVGYLQQVGRTMDVDLGSVKTIRSLSMDYLFYQSASVFLPAKVTYALSADGTHWRTAGSAAGNNRGTANEHRAVSLAIAPTYARYVKVVFDTNGYTFADELTVLGTDGRAPGARAPHGPAYRPEPLADQGYQRAGTPRVGGVRDMYLAYTYGPGNPNRAQGMWSDRDLLPIVSHVDTEGRPTDWMFDTVLWMAGGDASEYQDKAGWTDLIDRQFTPNVDVDALDHAVDTARSSLGGAPHRVKVVLPVPLPTMDSPTPWGELDGQTLDLNPDRVGGAKAAANRLKVVDWLIARSRARFAAGHYRNLDLAGFYWMYERIGPNSSDSALVQQTAASVHSHRLKFYWIPYYQAPGFQYWRSYGFDAAMLQPNYFFDDTLPASRLTSATQLARWAGLGVEVEGDEPMLTSPAAQQKFAAYLDTFHHEGADRALTGWYWGARDTTLGSARSTDPAARHTYDAAYAYLRTSR
ncbi:hypothetical protein BIV57_20590 [Mangrovactinospora gilvigrisea]|uniref:F5/8 type C domain-containing protein n=1 Tax=Mangrovactinospora gilvigrisea TaxID=1428644 RepID=A0A1J7C233_9ACTN|nr:DUF4855 domain-containing protein [Mangrovactinospora gilvigrisea]OIV35632.1 hypothetical protein BIV57_20590 [Mangrovactinospora gilvigrisea]